MGEKDIALLRAIGGGEIAEKMDSTTECITLTTSAFDILPPLSQEHLKKAMEIHLRQFGNLYLAALSFGFSKEEGVKEVSQVIKDSFKVLSDGLQRIISRNE